MTEFSSLNRSILANGGDVNYFIIGPGSLCDCFSIGKIHINARGGGGGVTVAPLRVRAASTS